ncbi:YeeE/YedE family protein [Piscinibacter sakaiensis]|uniref:Putative transmembrane protein n=1 Tax=Piscinibacter sakaiensis TaxID=1547922 RepID=A0A0K8P2A0_PISS1|nr:YeeE/YedE family protein [Piscinibacter sakaiensis]GAP36654.1 putative transmembrane protein [Piscinibacter sakaiensis]
MSELAAVEALRGQVLWAVFALSAVFGVISQRTHFCAMGAVADIVHLGDWTRMRMWVLAIGVALLGFNALVAFGWVRAADSVYARPQLLAVSALVGGALFGAGMVLASGCGSKTLLRLAGGNLKSLVVFLVLGLSAFATLRGLTAVWRVNTVDALAWTLPAGHDLPSLAAHWTGLSPRSAAAGLGLVLGAGCIAWVLARAEGRRGEVWLGGVGVGLVVVAVWAVSGILGHVPEHPQTLEPAFVATASRHMESLSFVAPSAHTLAWLLYYSDENQRLSLGVASVAGVVAGGAVQALASRSFRWEGFRNARDTGQHLVGAALMGVGGVTALGCTIGQGLSGISTLSVGSALALAGILAGAVATLRWQAALVERGVL